MAEENISELEDLTLESIQNKARGKTDKSKN